MNSQGRNKANILRQIEKPSKYTLKHFPSIVRDMVKDSKMKLKKPPKNNDFVIMIIIIGSIIIIIIIYYLHCF